MGFSLQSEYQCSRIAQMAAMDRKGDFSAEKGTFSNTQHLCGVGKIWKREKKVEKWK
jgi:hypothetical protein